MQFLERKKVKVFPQKNENGQHAFLQIYIQAHIRISFTYWHLFKFSWFRIFHRKCIFGKRKYWYKRTFDTSISQKFSPKNPAENTRVSFSSFRKSFCKLYETEYL